MRTHGCNACSAAPTSYGHREREPEQSINFVTCHDGFTLNDLVSYNEKHNEANGEGNRDGLERQSILELRRRGAERRSRRRGAAPPPGEELPDVAMLISIGTPMMLHGRRDAPHPAGQQQRLLPGQRDQLARLEPARAASGSPSLRAHGDRPSPPMEGMDRDQRSGPRRRRTEPQRAPAPRRTSTGTASGSTSRTGARIRTALPAPFGLVRVTCRSGCT